MYLPEHFRLDDTAQLGRLIHAHPLGTLIASGPEGLSADHIPFLLEEGGGEHGTLTCHVARGNPLWRALGEGTDVLVVFHGPQAYVTPSWYPSKAAHGQVVPTWNYLAVHARGRARVARDPAWLARHVERLTAAQEAGQPRPWRVSDAPEAFTQGMLGAIVGIEIPIARLEGKAKLSQNRPQADREGVAAGLAEQSDEAAQALAAWMRRANGGP